MTKRGGTTRAHHPRKVTQSTLNAIQERLTDSTNKAMRAAAKQEAPAPKSKPAPTPCDSQIDRAFWSWAMQHPILSIVFVVGGWVVLHLFQA